MPRDGSGVYSKPPGTTATPNTVIQSTVFNSVIDDIVNGINDIPLAESIVEASFADGAIEAKLGVDVNGTVATRTAMKALDTTLVDSVYLREAGREGQFIWRSGDYSAQITLDTLEGIYVKANAIATTSGAWVRAFNDSIEAKWFGVVGNDVADDGPALDASFAMAIYLGRRYRVNGSTGSTFKRTTQHVWDFVNAATNGLVIEGDGNQRSVINVRGVATSPQALITRSGGTVMSPLIQANARISDIGFGGDTTGTVLAIGDPTFIDQLNRSTFDMTVTNDTNNATCTAIEINALYHCYGILNAVLGGAIATGSSAIRIRKAAFCQMSIGGGNADFGFHLTDDYVFGNVFTAVDSEIVNYGGLIDTPNADKNIFIGGTLGYGTTGWLATAGTNNRILNPNKNAANQILSTDPAFRVGLQLDEGEFIGYNGLNEFGNMYWDNLAFNKTIVSGGTLAAPADGIARTTIWTTAGTAATLTITLPSSPVDRRHVEFHFVEPVTALTVTGGSVLGGAPTSVTAQQILKFTYISSDGVWVRC